VKNTGKEDLINLPAYVPDIPSQKNWLYNPKDEHEETNQIMKYIVGLQKEKEPTADDIMRTFITRRVLPLQLRVRKLCQMSGRIDTTQKTTFKLSMRDVLAKVKAIAKTHMLTDWKWGLKPFCHENPPPQVRFWRNSGITFPECSYMLLLMFDLLHFRTLAASAVRSPRS
jgi:hypothetical protein